MNLEDYFRFAVALILVLGLIGLLALLAKRFGMAPRITIRDTRERDARGGNTFGRGAFGRGAFGRGAFGRGSRGDKRVNIVDVTNIDGKRRLILVRRDDTEHLILLGINGETVIESKISGAGAPAAEPAPAAAARTATLRDDDAQA